MIFIFLSLDYQNDCLLSGSERMAETKLFCCCFPRDWDQLGRVRNEKKRRKKKSIFASWACFYFSDLHKLNLYMYTHFLHIMWCSLCVWVCAHTRTHWYTPQHSITITESNSSFQSVLLSVYFNPWNCVTNVLCVCMLQTVSSRLVLEVAKFEQCLKYVGRTTPCFGHWWHKRK